MYFPLKEDIRSFALQLMQRKDNKSPFLPPPTDAELKNFEETGTSGPTKRNFRVDVRGAKKRSAWNKKCARLFAEEMVKMETASTDDVELVESMFLSHISALCRQYRLGLERTNPDGDPKDSNMDRKRTRRRKVSHPFKVKS